MAVTAEVRRAIYNDALQRLGERRLAVLTENRDARRVLDEIWDGGVVEYCLEQGEWNVGIRAMALVASGTAEPAFGYGYVFEKPDDFVRLVSISTDGNFGHVLTAREYVEEAGHWFANSELLFLRYVSKHSDYGMDGARWPMTFRKYLAAQIAWEAAPRITGKEALQDRLARTLYAMRRDARAKNSLADGVKFMPRGSWAQAKGWSRNQGGMGGPVVPLEINRTPPVLEGDTVALPAGSFLLTDDDNLLGDS